MKIKAIAILFATVVLLAGLHLYSGYVHAFDDIQIEKTGSSLQRTVCHIGEEYFYVQGTSVYQYGSEKEIRCETIPQIVSDGESLEELII